MAKTSKFSKQMLKLIHKFNRYNKREKWFVVYLLLLLASLILLPIVKIDPVRGNGYSVWLVSGSYFKTMLIVLVSMIVLLGRNLSFKFKSIMLSYFSGKDHDSFINFLFLFIITTSFFSITDTINVSAGVTTAVSLSGGGKFIQFLLLVGVILTLVSVIKSAKELGNKTKIINMVDENHKKNEHNKEDIKKGLFE